MKKKLKTIAIVLVVVLLSATAILDMCWQHTDIPKLYLEGDISGMEDKKDARNISFVYDDGAQEISGFAEIKIQGTSSIFYEKKNYTLKFYEDEAHEDKLKIDAGWGPEYKYCMKANWIDRTQARNVVSAKLVSQMQEKYGLLTEAPCNGAVDGFPVEIYSGGKFLGLYTFNIPKDEWQFAMDGDDPNHLLIAGDLWEPANFFQGMPDFTTWELEVGEETDETMEKMNRLFDFVINSTDEEFRENFAQYLDLDAALNYYVFADVAYLRDNIGKNMLLATYDGMKWYLSLYDLDSSWGTFTDGKSEYPYREELVDMGLNNLFARMEKAFPQELAQRYFELRGSVLSNEHIMAEFEAFREQIPTLSFAKEIIRWGHGVIRKPADLPGYDYDQIEGYLATVSDRLDAKYSAMLGE